MKNHNSIPYLFLFACVLSLALAQEENATQPSEESSDKNKSSTMPYVIAGLAASGALYLVYKNQANRPAHNQDTTIKEKSSKPPEKEESTLKKPEDELIMEKGSSKRPEKPQEELKALESENLLSTPRDSGVSGAPETSPDLKAMEDIFVGAIQKIVTSDQIGDAQEFREPKTSGKFSWKRTHFVFVIDCSGSMKGVRWDSVTFGFKACLNRMRRMEEIQISGFTFDDEVHDFCREVTPRNALKLSKDMLFSAKGTNYIAALEHAMKIIEEAKNKNYLSCIMFLSDGLGGFPEHALQQLKDMKKQGKKILFYTIACVTDEDDDMELMSRELGGEHYKVTNAEASKIVFTNILEV